MAFLVKNSVIINDQRELIGVNTAGINTTLYVGSDIQADAVSGIITATEFIGIGSQLRDIPGLSWISSTAPIARPNGDALQDGDLYYDPTRFRQFTYYDGDAGGWRDSNPAANAALDYAVEGTDGQVIPGTDTLRLDASDTNIVLGVTTSTDSVTFALANDVSITNTLEVGDSLEVGAGVSIYMDGGAGIVTSANGTPIKYFGDGSGITNLSVDASSFLDVLGVRAGILTVTGGSEFVGVATFSSDINANGNIVGDNSTNISGINSVTATNFYGDGSGITNIDADNVDLTGTDQSFNSVAITTTTGVALDVTGDVSIGGTVGFAQTANFAGNIVVTGETIGFGSAFFGDILANNLDLAFGNLTGDSNTNISGINSVTATTFYGDGSGLTNVSGAADTYNTVANDSEDNDLPMPFLSAVGAGASLYTDSTTNEEFTYNPSSGILKAKEFDALSDARLKTDIVRIDDALGKVAELRGVEYNWINGSGSSVGVIAQELQQVYPQLVSDNGERLTVNYNGLVGLLIAAVNELSTELNNLKESK